ncbi:uncharacterized protein K460DRAFT_119734 [Cucurbitaria berberidis CBS 394.84]|uniref:Uncharacterized protein n=1 Tax=Cucurbitaria berberidis CBS 394.84 TaxID=1168544 RepID=A0A9P4GH77_9PLEO|nr:uncharacterized protein K460DRAFT_119734 [Cucurbitaria berberidis CBS 394.84]KAF1846078.1 hypothetical protein K460DRAFT_119734 [Cucurbitaria berberidis CBS 394.84]
MDLVHALLCVGYYHGQLNTTKKATDRAQRLQNLSEDIADGKKERDDNDRREASTSHSVREVQGSSIDAADIRTQIPPHNDHSETFSSGNQNATSSPPPPTKPHTYHPLLSNHLTPTERLILQTIWDTMMITILSLHIFSFFSNIAPSRAFCYTPAALQYPDWAFHDSALDWKKGKEARPPQLGMKERCERINWSLHSAGGFSSAGAAVLAALHLVALVCRVGEHMRLRLERWMMDTKLQQNAEVGRGRGQSESDKWGQQTPRDIDIHARGIHDHIPSESHTTTDQPTTLSEEEQNTGLRQRKRPALEERTGENGLSKLDALEQSMWSAALLECLLP